MKKIIFALPLLMIGINPAFANSDNLKIKTVKEMYNAVIKEARKGNEPDTLDFLFKYADKSLQHSVAIAKIYFWDNEAEEFTMCNTAFDTFNLNTSQDQGVYEAKSIDYKVLKDGKVRASVKYTGKENINSPKFSHYKDFSLKCTSSACKITDVYDSERTSGRLSAEKYCK